MKLVRMLSVVILLMSLVACGGSGNLTKKDSCVPEWFLNPPQDANYLFASKVSKSKDLQLALDKAAVDARDEIGKQIELKLMSLDKKFTEEVGDTDDPTILQQYISVKKIVVSTRLTGSQVIKKDYREKGFGYEAFVLVQYPIGAANAAFVEQIKKHKELETRFRGSQAFQDLEKEVQDYEKWKKEQGN